MFYPDISLEEWFRRYPTLSRVTDLRCACGAARRLRPAVSTSVVGVSYDGCETCGRRGGMSAISRTENGEGRYPKRGRRHLRRHAVAGSSVK